MQGPGSRYDREIRTEPLCFELLPKKFTIRQMQDLYEAILDETLDNRNFRKKDETAGIYHSPS